MHRIFAEIAYGKWGMDPRAIQGYLPLVMNIIRGTAPAIDPVAAAMELKKSIAVQFATKQSGVYNVSDYGEASKPEDAPENSVAIIGLKDAITYSDADCGPAGMVTKAGILKRTFSNQNISAVVFDMDTPGGDGCGMFHMIRQMNESNKPIVAFVRRLGASAGAGIASASNYIIAESELTEFGSFGTFVSLVDFKEYYREQGVFIEDIYATRSTEKNEDYREAVKGNFKPIQENIDVFNETFLETVATNRTGKLTDDGHWHKGKLYYAPEALAIGLIDEIGSFDRAIEKALELANQ